MLTTDPEVGAEPPGDRPEPGPPPAGDAPRSRHRVARVVGAVGRLMMTSGVVILLLVAYQLWGTNLQTNRSQGELADEFAGLVGDGESATTTTAPPTTAATTTTDGGPPATLPPQVAPTIAPPGPGEVIGSFRIPAIGRDDYFTVEGIGTDQLKRGAAHYPGTPLPGQAGNAAVAGHRTTYGAPLHDVDDLVPGDEIFFTTLQGEFTYRVREIKIVDPSEVSVIQPQNPTPEKPEGENLLTLTACHPKFSAAQRIIVVSELVGQPVPQLQGQQAAAEEVRQLLGEDSGGASAIDPFVTEPALTFPGAWWGLVCMLVWGLTRVGALLLRRTKVPWILSYVVGLPATVFVLYLFFESFSYEGFARTVGLNI